MLTRLVGRCAPGIAAVASLFSIACGGPGDGEIATTPTAIPTAAPSPSVAPSTPSVTPTGPTPTPTTAPTVPAPTQTEVAHADEPRGLPLDPSQPVGWTDHRDVDRHIVWGAGPGAFSYSRDYQPGDDPLAANAGGWNCRVHVEFEDRPAVDWYVPVGTPIRATMTGTATLFAITTTNAFDFYGVPRAPYVGFPSPAASVSPFPGPGGGKGIFVELRSDGFVTESAHLALGLTLATLPRGAYLPGFDGGDEMLRRFAPMRGYLDATPIASWQVERGDVIGFSGDSGYSEAPHLHYTVRRSGGGLLCPTLEDGFADGGWLFR